MEYSFQLYSARNFTPWADVLNELAELGYTQVEGFGGVLEDVPGLKAALASSGLKMPSSHFALTDLEDKFDEVIATAKSLDVTQLYAPYLDAADRPTNPQGWVDLALRLAAVGKAVSEAGLRFGWHNHDFEFEACEDGSIPMQLILDTAPEIEWEADIAWVLRGGADPFEWIEKYGSRISATHVKDIAVDGENTDEDGWADVGHGTVNWATLMEKLRAAGCTLFVAEHDNPSDLTRFASRSMDTLKTF